MRINKCTFTGVDTKVNKSDIELISSVYPFVEWGYLYSISRAGTPGRYMAANRIEDHLKTLTKSVNTSLHICGKAVSDFISSVYGYHDTLIEAIKDRGGRVQLNFNCSKIEVNLNLLAEKIKMYNTVTFIIQENKGNAGVINYLLQVGVTNIAALFDSSGGRGVLGKWRAPLGIPCGYAGGLGPENIEKELISINRVVGNRSVWVDMESKIRQVDHNNIDYMSLPACEQVLQVIKRNGYN